MTTVNRRRRSILKSTRNSMVNGILEDSSNLNFNGTLTLPNKRVSFGHKQIKEFQLHVSNSESPVPSPASVASVPALKENRLNWGDTTLYSYGTMDVVSDNSVNFNATYGHALSNRNGNDHDEINKTIREAEMMNLSLDSDIENTTPNCSMIMDNDNNFTVENPVIGCDLPPPPSIGSNFNPPVVAPSPMAILTPRSMKTRSMASMAAVTATMIPQPKNLFHQDFTFPATGNGLVMRVPSLSPMGKVLTNPFRNKKAKKQPLGCVFMSPKTPRRKPNIQAETRTTTTCTGTNTTPEVLGRQCSPFKTKTAGVQARDLLINKVLINATCQTDALNSPQLRQLHESLKQDEISKVKTQEDVLKAGQDSRLEETLPQEDLRSQGSNDQTFLADVNFAASAQSDPTLNHPQSPLVITPPRPDNDRWKFHSVTSLVTRENDFSMQSLSLGPSEKKDNCHQQQIPITQTTLKNMSMSMEESESEEQETSNLPDEHHNTTFVLQNKLNSPPGSSCFKEELTTYHQQQQQQSLLNTTAKNCSFEEQDTVEHTTTTDATFVMENEFSMQPSSTQSEELLDHQQSPIFDTTVDTEDDEPLPLEEQKKPEMMPTMPSKSASPLSFSVSPSLFSYITHCAQWNVEKRIREMANVMPEIVTMKEDNYMEFKSLCTKCFKPLAWESFDIHRRIAKDMGFSPLSVNLPSSNFKY